MSKQQKSAGTAFSDATPQQIALAKQIIEDADKHRYYVTRIYGVYNAVIGKNDAPSTCASCLRTRVREIKKWYEEGQKYAAYITSKKQSPTPPVIEPVNTQLPADYKKALEDANKPADAPKADNNPPLTEEQQAAAEADLKAKAAEAIDLDRKQWYEDVLALGLSEESTPEQITDAFQPLLTKEGVTAEAHEYYNVQRAKALEVAHSKKQEGQGTATGTKLTTTHGGVLVFTTNEGAEFENGAKGTVIWEDGKKVNAGTYKTTEGHDVKVQVGGKATYAENYDDLL